MFSFVWSWRFPSNEEMLEQVILYFAISANLIGVNSVLPLIHLGPSRASKNTGLEIATPPMVGLKSVMMPLRYNSFDKKLPF